MPAVSGVPKPCDFEPVAEPAPVSIKSLGERLLLEDFTLVGVAGRAEVGVGDGSLHDNEDAGIVSRAVVRGRAGERVGIGGAGDVGTVVVCEDTVLKAVEVTVACVVSVGASVSASPTDVLGIATVTGAALPVLASE